MKLVVYIGFLAICFAQEKLPKKQIKRTYVCPPHFLRLSHRCYYFSKEKTTWQNAFFNCNDLHSNLALIRSPFQNKLLKRTMKNSPTMMLDRWIGAMYQWKNMSWVWATSGKQVTFNDFYQNQTKNQEELKWNCVFMDSKNGYRWNSDSCLAQKHYVCHTKIKLVSSKGKKKLLRQYNANKFNRLNEIPVPVIGTPNNTTGLKLDVNSNLNAQYAYRRKPQKRSRKGKKKKKSYGLQFSEKTYPNGTFELVFDFPQKEQSTEKTRKRRKNKDEIRKTNIENIKWKTYYEDSKNPLYPRPVVEEYNVPKD